MVMVSRLQVLGMTSSGGARNPRLDASTNARFRASGKRKCRRLRDLTTVLPPNLTIFTSFPFPHRLILFLVPDFYFLEKIRITMQLFRMLTLPILSAILLPHRGVATPTPDHAVLLAPADGQSRFGNPRGRRALVHGLPPGWTAVFETITSLQPPLVNPAFIKFFSEAAQLAAADPVPDRPVQRINYGALALEFIANNSQGQTVTKEFVEAASVWLLEAAQNGWTGFFKAWVLDLANGEIVYIQLINVWDEVWSLTY